MKNTSCELKVCCFYFWSFVSPRTLYFPITNFN